jgi:hypothetical protein
MGWTVAILAALAICFTFSIAIAIPPSYFANRDAGTASAKACPTITDTTFTFQIFTAYLRSLLFNSTIFITIYTPETVWITGRHIRLIIIIIKLFLAFFSTGSVGSLNIPFFNRGAIPRSLPRFHNL